MNIGPDFRTGSADVRNRNCAIMEAPEAALNVPQS
jgi:hypothetical protein